MRVLVVSNMYLSGNGNWVSEQVRSLRGAGIEVDVIFLNTKRTRLLYGLALPGVARAIASGQYDLLHTHHTYTAILSYLASRVIRSEIPIVLTNHEPEITDRKGRTRTWHPTSLLRHSLAIKRFAANRCAFVIFVWRELAQVLSIRQPYDIVPCGVDLTVFRPMDRRRCRRDLGIPEDRPVLFFPGDPRNPRKRFALACEVFRRVRMIHPEAILLTGGRIASDAMPVYYNAANVVIQTSFCEASPTVVKEALACEVPVVSTDAGDTFEVVQGVRHCWVCAEDASELARRVVEALPFRAEGGRQQLIRKQLTLPQVARRIIEVYKRVLSGEGYDPGGQGEHEHCEPS